MKSNGAKQQILEKIKIENLTVPKFYYKYFPFKKGYLNKHIDIDLPIIVRKKKNSEDFFEIIDRTEIYEWSLIEKNSDISCIVKKMNDIEARVYALEATLMSKTLTVIQAIACRQEILRLGGECSPADVIHFSRKTSKPTYDRAFKSFTWFQNTARTELFPNVSESTEIELIAHCIDQYDNKGFKELNFSQKELLSDFVKIYLENDEKMKVNSFLKKYYKRSETAEENQRKYPFTNTVWKRRAQSIVENLIRSSEEFLILIQQQGRNKLSNEMMKSLIEDSDKANAIAALSREFVKIASILSKVKPEDNPLLFNE